jgi:hypothetical protein
MSNRYHLISRNYVSKYSPFRKLCLIIFNHSTEMTGKKAKKCNGMAFETFNQKSRIQNF